MKKILLTGAAGFIGSHLAERLVERGDRVLGIDSFDPYYDPAVKRGNIHGLLGNPAFHLQEIDICDRTALLTAVRPFEPDVVVHLAARAGVRPSLENPTAYYQTNVIGSQHVIDACLECAPGHLVFASSSSVYGGLTQTPFVETLDVAKPISPYAATKRMNELMAHVYHETRGLNVTLLRFFTVYGPRQRPDMAIHKFVRLAEEGKPLPFYGDGATRRDYTYIDDIIDGVVKAIDTPLPYAIINLGEQTTTSLAELIELIAKHTGKDIVLDRQPMQPGDVAVTYADIAKARDLLGYAPRFTMDEGVARFVAWYRQQPCGALA